MTVTTATTMATDPSRCRAGAEPGDEPAGKVEEPLVAGGVRRSGGAR